MNTTNTYHIRSAQFVDWRKLLTMNMPLLRLFGITYEVSDITMLWTYISGRVRDIMKRCRPKKWKEHMHDRMKTWSMLDWVHFKKMFKKPIDYRIPVEFRKQCVRSGTDSFQQLQIDSEESFDGTFHVLSIAPEVIKPFVKLLQQSYDKAPESDLVIPHVAVRVVEQPTASEDVLKDIQQKQADSALAFKQALEEAEKCFASHDGDLIQKTLDKAKAACEQSNEAHRAYLALF